MAAISRDIASAAPPRIGGLHFLVSIGLFLKRIIPVRIPAAEQEPEGAEEVGGDEEEAPAFVLADVDSLVRAGGVEVILGAGQDGVAEGDGGGSTDKRGAAEEPGGKAAVELEYSLHQLPAATGEQSEGAPEQAEEGPGRGPEIGEDSEHGNEWRNSNGE